MAASLCLASAAPATAQDAPTTLPKAEADVPTWPFEASDLPVDPAYRFGELDNGLRYILRENATPEGTALVRMRIGSGSLDETESERGLSHYLEHMAFNGSTGIPEGEMIALLEREGLAFGADTNASTGFETITYKLNLPRNDEALLDTALMLMRETASELTIAEDAVERERGVILAERRDRRNFAQEAREDAMRFVAPGARYIDRLPIGTLDILESADAADLRALYERTYTAPNTLLVVVGDFPVDVMEAAIHARFANWEGGTAPVEPETGPVDVTRGGLAHIHLHPALSERVTVTLLGPWVDEADTRARRRAAITRSIGYGIIARRLSRLARSSDAPFRAARFARGTIFEDARSNTLTVTTEDGKWRAGMLAAIREVNQALTHGFTDAEMREQIANIRTSLENRAAGAATRANSFYVAAALNLVANEVVPTEPAFQLALFEEVVPTLDAETVHAALIEDALALEKPLIRFQGRRAPDGGEEALTRAFAEAMALAIAAPQDAGPARFAYDDFGEPGAIISDERDERLGFRLITFANGVRLTIKDTDIREDRIAYRMSLDGGTLMNTAEEPLRTYLVGSLANGGLGRHSRDELQSVLAGRSVGLSVAAASDAFSFAGITTPRDLTLQMQVLAAALSDPGYRPEGLEQFRRGIDNFFKTLRATPLRAYGNAAGAVLSNGDPRFTLQPRDAFFALDYKGLEAVISDRLEEGAIELALVGDIDEEAAIAAVAATLGALPPREIDFRPREAARQRQFTTERGPVILRHEGESDQALVRLVWPTKDDSDFAEELRLGLLARVIRIRLTETLREELGNTYAPTAESSMSSIYPDYGTFTISASVDVAQVAATRMAIAQVLSELQSGPIDEDLVARARQPMLEAYDNALKSLGGWMQLADRAQSQADRLERWFAGPDLLRGITAEELSMSARQYLCPGEAVEFLVLPEEAPAPASAR
ncbi:MAG: insulinase family protein [Erythrobacter sp.]|nr:insulinase family protein [Erythrobacter sp.]